MFLAAALIPDTALLVPGAGGAADAGAGLRKAADEAVGEALEGAERVVIVAPGSGVYLQEPPLRGALGAAGVPDELLAWTHPGEPDAPVPEASPSVALFLLARHLVRGRPANLDARVQVVDALVPSDEHARRAPWLRELGRCLVDDSPTAFVVVGSPSGRHGPDAPLADDERAPAYDEALLADLAEASPAARLRLAALDPVLAGDLAVTGWGPWQVLLGAACDATVSARLVTSEVLAGACHAVLTWRVTA